jgi:site-specific DNA-methyltransferase (adenine-specific)
MKTMETYEVTMRNAIRRKNSLIKAKIHKAKLERERMSELEQGGVRQKDIQKFLGSLQLDRVYQWDTVCGMKMIPDNGVDLIIADPPYNAGGRGTKVKMNKAKYKSINEKWDTMNDEEFGFFNFAWITECFRVLKPGGTFLCFASIHNLFDVGTLMPKIGFKINQKYEWKKVNPVPALLGTNAVFSTESIILGSKLKKCTFNLDYAKSINNGKNIHDVFVTNQTPPKEKKHGKFPCQKPLELAIKLINLHSQRGDIVLLPFCGSGTEAVASVMTGRRFITFERETEYIEIANKRLDNIEDFHSDLIR